MRRTIAIASIPVAGLLLAGGSSALADGWVNYVNETSVRMPTGAGLNDPNLTVNDDQEKDYAWGDIDNDGDTDLICVRKQPFTSAGKDTNIVFMNEGIAEGHSVNGVLVDRTALYASASDVPGDQGFLTATNDRDVVLVDLDLDGWLDMVTAPTLTDNQAKNLSHPRVYMNLGEVGGVWQGFRYEDARIPQMHPNAGPRFCSVAAGDLTGDGYPDLYFGDYDSGGSQISDYNNKLLINDGNGFFTDDSNTRLTSEMRLSAFGAASVIADINQDGVNDVVKQTSLNAPQHVAVTYNDPGNEGVFVEYDIVNQLAPYFVSVDDLNNDGRLDLVIVDDGTDTYLLNQGNGPDGYANFTTLQFPSGASAGFGGNSLSADLNNDGFRDVIVTDVDVDIAGCSRTTAIYRNLGNLPNVSFQVQGEVIPFNQLQGVHDAAIFDLDGNGWLDIVMGKCNGTQVWMNVPPIGLVFSYPQGVPSFLNSDEVTSFDVEVATFGGGTFQKGSAFLWLSVDGGGYAPLPLEDLGGGTLRANIPAFACTTRVRFYLSGSLDGGGQFTDPPSAPAAFFTAVAADGSETAVRDEIEGDVSGWTVADSGDPAGSGRWEAVDPNGTQFGGAFAAPEDDATAGAENVKAWITDQGPAGGSAGIADVDNLIVSLTSPVIDLDGSDATISFARWFFCDDEGVPGAEDFFTVEVTNDGVNWVEIPELTTGGTGSAWETVAFVVGDAVVPTANVQVRFVTGDLPNNSLTEAGVDNFQVDIIICGEACNGDLDGDGEIAFGDLLILLSAWGDCPGCDADLDGDGAVAFSDVLVILSAWGACP